MPQSLPELFRITNSKLTTPHTHSQCLALPEETLIKAQAEAFPSLPLPPEQSWCFSLWPRVVWYIPPLMSCSVIKVLFQCHWPLCVIPWPPLYIKILQVHFETQDTWALKTGAVRGIFTTLCRELLNNHPNPGEAELRNEHTATVWTTLL